MKFFTPCLVLFGLSALPALAADPVTIQFGCGEVLDGKYSDYNPAEVTNFFSLVLSEQGSAKMLKLLSRDEAVAVMSVYKLCSGPDSSGADAYQLTLARVADEPMFLGEAPQVKGRTTEMATIRVKDGAIIDATWFDRAAGTIKREIYRQGLPMTLSIDYRVKTGMFSSQNIKLLCPVKGL
jgi:hypothetical protein